jgi:hypothetical protein
VRVGMSEGLKGWLPVQHLAGYDSPAFPACPQLQNPIYTACRYLFE